MWSQVVVLGSFKLKNDCSRSDQTESNGNYQNQKQKSNQLMQFNSYKNSLWTSSTNGKYSIRHNLSSLCLHLHYSTKATVSKTASSLLHTEGEDQSAYLSGAQSDIHRHTHKIYLHKTIIIIKIINISITLTIASSEHVSF